MTSSAATVLIVEDDPDIRRLVVDLLERERFDVAEAGDGAEMAAVLERTQPDLIILDVMLPGEDGLQLCRELRAKTTIPIIMLTARADEIDRVLGLELGADDYVVKPFGSRELVARVRAALRRARTTEPVANERRFQFEGFLIDLDARQLTGPASETIVLTTAEFDLLATFVERPRRVLTRDHILARTYGRKTDPFDRTVDMLVSRLRKKLAAAAPDSTLISTVRNGGYLFTAAVRRAP